MKEGEWAGPLVDVKSVRRTGELMPDKYGRVPNSRMSGRDSR